MEQVILDTIERMERKHAIELRKLDAKYSARLDDLEFAIDQALVSVPSAPSPSVQLKAVDTTRQAQKELSQSVWPTEITEINKRNTQEPSQAPSVVDLEEAKTSNNSKEWLFDVTPNSSTELQSHLIKSGYLTSQDVQDRYGVSSSTVYLWAKPGRDHPRAVRIGKTVLFAPSDVEKYARKLGRVS